MAVMGNVLTLSLQQRKGAGGREAPALLGLCCSTPKSERLLQPFPSAFEHSVSPPNAQKDISMESFQPPLQIP